MCPHNHQHLLSNILFAQCTHREAFPVVSPWNWPHFQMFRLADREPSFQMHVYVLLTVVWILRAVGGFSSGEVQKSCDTMEPQHLATNQTSPAPFSISVNHTTFQEGDVIAGNHHCCVKLKYRMYGVWNKVPFTSVFPISKNYFACNKGTNESQCDQQAFMKNGSESNI